MNNIVVYIPKDMDARLLNKIAETFRIHKIKTTNDINRATVIIQPESDQNMIIKNIEIIIDAIQKPTIENVALESIHDIKTELYKLNESVPMVSVPLYNTNKRKKFIQTKYQNKNINIKNKQIFNRTKCK